MSHSSVFYFWSVLFCLVCSDSALAETPVIEMAPGETKVVGELQITVKSARIVPLETKRCISTRLSGACASYETTYSVHGISCTEDCILMSRSEICALRNRCDYDSTSGCFRKSVCVEISPSDACRKWEEVVAC